MLLLLLFCSVSARVLPSNDANPTSPPEKLDSKMISAEVRGVRTIQSVEFGTYLGCHANDSKVALTKVPADEAEQWAIYYRKNGKVEIRTVHIPFHFLRVNFDGSVRMIDRPWDWSSFNPFKNSDESWSFQSFHGTWLCAFKDGSLKTVQNRTDSRTHFKFSASTDSKISPTVDDMIVSANVAGKRRLLSVSHTRAAHNSRYLHAVENESFVDITQKPADWFIEASEGKVTFKTTHTPARFLSGHRNGTVELVAEAGKSEEWTPFNYEDGSWAFLSAHGLWLSSHKNGSVFSTKARENSEHFWLESWTVSTTTSAPTITTTTEPTSTTTDEGTTTPWICKSSSTTTSTTTTTTPAPKTELEEFMEECGGKRFLKSVHGTYLRSWMSLVDKELRGVSVNLAPHALEWEHWYIEEYNGKVAIKSFSDEGLFLSSYANRTIWLAGHKLSWETWTPTKNSDGSWSLLGYHNEYLSANEDGTVQTMDKNKSWEHFWCEPW